MRGRNIFSRIYFLIAILVITTGAIACSGQGNYPARRGDSSEEAEEGGQAGIGDMQEPANTIPPLDTEPPEAQVISGKCGDDAVWSYHIHNRLLQITGSGVVDQKIKRSGDYVTEYGLKKRYRVKEIRIGEGITALDGRELFINVMKADSAREIKLSLPDSLVRIGMDTFDPAMMDVGEIRHIHIPRQVRYIEEGAFWGLGDGGFRKKMKFTVDRRNPYYTMKDGVLFTKDKKTLVYYPKEKSDKVYHVPETVTRIMALAFAGNLSLTEVVLPENIEEIGGGAFYGAYKLAKINLEQAKKIKWLRDFDGKKNRVRTTDWTMGPDDDDVYPDECWHYPDDYWNDPKDRKDPFEEDCYGSYEMYHLGTFAGTDLRSIRFPDRLKYASYNTFRGCGRLRKISLGRSFSGEINSDKRCDKKGVSLYRLGLEDICVHPQNAKYTVRNHILYSRDGKILYQAFHSYRESELVVEREVEKIAKGAFLKIGWGNAPNLKKVVILGNLKEVGSSAFVGSEIRKFEAYGNIGSIGDGAFRCCREMKKFICHGSVKRIGEEAFYDAWQLWKFSFRNTLEHIGERAFSGCDNLDVPRIRKKKRAERN